MVDEFNAREEDGNWSDKDIVIACVHLFERYSSFQQNSGFCSRLVGPTASGKSSVSFSSFRGSSVILTSLKFVEQAAGIEGLSRGGLGSSTEEISVFKFPFPGLVDSSICLVDTPGIDGERDPYDIIHMIYVWFNKAYVQVLCLIFLGPVIDIRFDRLVTIKKLVWQAYFTFIPYPTMGCSTCDCR